MYIYQVLVATLIRFLVVPKIFQSVFPTKHNREPQKNKTLSVFSIENWWMAIRMLACISSGSYTFMWGIVYIVMDRAHSLQSNVNMPVAASSTSSRLLYAPSSALNGSSRTAALRGFLVNSINKKFHRLILVTCGRRHCLYQGAQKRYRFAST